MNSELSLNTQIAWSAFQEKKNRQLTQNEYRVQKKQDLLKNSSPCKGSEKKTFLKNSLSS